MDENEIVDSVKGYAFQTKRIIMAPSTYPKSWHSKRMFTKDKTETKLDN